jgi:NAD-dependent deacetylase
MTEPIPLDDPTRLLVLTGAGVSAESGLPTFRDANGLWEQHRVEEVASPGGFENNPTLVWRFYSQRRAAASRCQPNAGHLALAKVERRLADRFLLVTQNVDGLHLRAGSQRVVELHGNLFTSRCSRCDRQPFPDERLYEDALPECEQCREAGGRSLLRPHIVWFGESLSPAHLRRIEAFSDEARGKLVFLAVGTSGVVYPAAGLVDLAKGYGADTWLVNAERPDNSSAFGHFVQGRSAEMLPTLLGFWGDVSRCRPPT